MKEKTKPVKPPYLGIIGQAHFRQRFETIACEMDSFQYNKQVASPTMICPE